MSTVVVTIKADAGPDPRTFTLGSKNTSVVWETDKASPNRQDYYVVFSKWPFAHKTWTHRVRIDSCDGVVDWHLVYVPMDDLSKTLVVRKDAFPDKTSFYKYAVVAADLFDPDVIWKLTRQTGPEVLGEDRRSNAPRSPSRSRRHK